MSKNYAVFHTEKGTVSSAVIGRHIDRTEGAEYAFMSMQILLKKFKHSF